MAEDVYPRLREFLDGMPGGFPATESGVEIKILRKLFTPEEAEMVMHLKPFPETASAIRVIPQFPVTDAPLLAMGCSFFPR